MKFLNTAMVNFITVVYFFFLLVFPVVSNATLSESDFRAVAEKFVPVDFASKTDSSGSPLKLGSGIGVSFVQGNLDHGGNFNYLVVAYRAADSEKGDICKIVVVKVSGKNKYTAMGNTVSKSDDNYGSCADLKIVNLDNNTSKQVLVTASAGKSSDDYHLFQWDGNKLNDITPIEKNPAGYSDTALSDIKIVEGINGNSLVINNPPSNEVLPGDHLMKVYQMKNGTLANIGSFDFFQILEKEVFDIGRITTLKPSLAAGTYTLEIKNLSIHNRAVRAEVSVNGSVVLRPQDFCSSPQPKKSDKDKWRGNDDDDDRDEDHCKRCNPKQDVYAIVNLKAASEMKVKVYGRQDSKLQITLVKRP